MITGQAVILERTVMTQLDSYFGGYLGAPSPFKGDNMFGEGMLDPADVAEKMNHRDFILIYCPECSQRVEFAITHPTADGSHYQVINLPDRIADVMEWNPKDIVCATCANTLKIERRLQTSRPMEMHVSIDAQVVERKYHEL